MLLVILVCAQFFICGYSLAMRETLPMSAELSVQNSFDEFSHSHVITNQNHAWNRIQYELKCCGLHGSADYRRQAIPFSCRFRSENPEEHSGDKLFSRGCLDVVSSNLRELLLYTALVTVVCAVIQVNLKLKNRELLFTYLYRGEPHSQFFPWYMGKYSRSILMLVENIMDFMY